MERNNTMSSEFSLGGYEAATFSIMLESSGDVENFASSAIN